MDWWPAPLAHIPSENHWDHADVVVAEVKSFDESPRAGQRRSFTALVPVNQMEAVSAALANLDHDVSASGPHPFYSKDRAFEPKFWIGARNLPADRYEPLVLGWTSHDQTILQMEPGFLMTYGLAPRTLNDGAVYWDDPTAPRHNVVTVTPPSKWKFPLATHAYVTISKDYLQDYLTLRHMALIEVYWEIRWGQIDAEIEQHLTGRESVDIDFLDRRLHLGRDLGNPKCIFAQVWGARMLAGPSALPITADPLDEEGLVWPGIDSPVTQDIAHGLGILAYVYVDDAVLGAYEGRSEYSINPMNGSVGFGTQWEVGYCDRVGRNLIRLEVKKLYEGVPAAEIRHWHQFAVDPLPISAFPAVPEERNIAKRAHDLIYAMVGLGEALSKLAQSLGLAIPPEEFAGLRRSALDYSGWWKFEETEPVARHISLQLRKDDFLDRCMTLNKLIIEGINEGNLRRMLLASGVPAQALKELRALKLLDALVRLAQISIKSGLPLAGNGALLWERLTKEGTQPPQPIGHLFGLYDLRILKGHKAGGGNDKLQAELTRFGIQPGEEAGGYGKILDQIYDLLASELDQTSKKVEAVA